MNHNSLTNGKHDKNVCRLSHIVAVKKSENQLRWQMLLAISTLPQMVGTPDRLLLLCGWIDGWCMCGCASFTGKPLVKLLPWMLMDFKIRKATTIKEFQQIMSAYHTHGF